MVRVRILCNVRFESDPRAFEEDHLAGPVVLQGVTVVRVVEPAEVGGDANRVAARRDVFEHLGIPDAFLALPVRPVVVQVAELPDERAVSNSWSADDRDTHARSFYVGSEARRSATASRARVRRHHSDEGSDSRSGLVARLRRILRDFKIKRPSPVDEKSTVERWVALVSADAARASNSGESTPD